MKPYKRIRTATTCSEMVVDLHSYLFEPCYLPLEEMLKQQGVPKTLASLSKRLLDLMTGRAEIVSLPYRLVLDAVGEDDSFEPLADLLTTVVSKEFARRIVSQVLTPSGECLCRSAGAFQTLLKSDELYAVLEEIEETAWPGDRVDILQSQFDQVSRVILRVEQRKGFEPSEFLEMVGDWAFRRFRRALLWFLETLYLTIEGDASGTALDFVKFLLLMLSNNTFPQDNMFPGFRRDQNVESGVEMMRGARKVCGNENSQRRMHTERIEELAIAARAGGEKFVGFVSFDFRRSEGIRIVKFESTRSSVGVQSYPPTGFPAYDIGAQQKDRLAALFAYCSREQIPILTHCSPSAFEGDHTPGALSDPQYWLEALKEHPDLKLCYGHAGGGGEMILDQEKGLEVLHSGWYAENGGEWADHNNFARKVVEQCCRFSNVFCDFSYFGSVVKDREKAIRFKRNVIAALGGPNGDLHFGNKIMYASDWHIPNISRRPDDVLEFWREFFDDIRFAPFRDGFFFKNALRFVNYDAISHFVKSEQPQVSASTTVAFRGKEEFGASVDSTRLGNRNEADLAPKRFLAK